MSNYTYIPAVPPPEPFAPAAPESEHLGFFTRLPGSFSYPFRHGGLGRLITGGVIIWLGLLAAKFGGRGLILSAPILGYLATYLLHIANASGDGSDEIPGFPRFERDMVSNFIMLNLAILLSLLPIGLYIFAIYWWHAPFRYVILPAYFSFFFLPMAFLRVCMLQTLEALNPIAVLQSIFRVPTAYMGLCLVMSFLGWVDSLVDMLCLHIPYAGALISGFTSFYFIVLFMRVLGLFYFVYRDKLDWFSGLLPVMDEPPQGEGHP